VTLAAPSRYTPPGLAFDEPTHVYTFNGKTQIHVTGALTVAGLIDRAWLTEEGRTRGTLVHAAIALATEDPSQYGDAEWPAAIAPYLAAHARFLSESGFRIDAVEERVCDPRLACAGTIDLRGQLPGGPSALDVIDVIDLKTGEVPRWVGYQTAGYVRLLPPMVERRCRRWCLNLRDDGTYRLIPLTKHSDASVFLAAVTVAQAQRGWL
jgi:hypothetical protein